MYIFYAITVITILILLLPLFAKIKLEISYCKNEGEKLTLSVVVSIFGRQVFKTDGKSVPIFSEKDKKHEKDTEEKGEKLIDKIKSLADSIAMVKAVYSKNKYKIKKCIAARDMEIYIKFGLFDAMQTGIATGLLWALLYNALALISTVGTVYEHKFEVVPVFDKSGFCSSGKGIFCFKLINVIGVLLRVYITYKRYTKKKKSV